MTHLFCSQSLPKTALSVDEAGEGSFSPGAIEIEHQRWMGVSLGGIAGALHALAVRYWSHPSPGSVLLHLLRGCSSLTALVPDRGRRKPFKDLSSQANVPQAKRSVDDGFLSSVIITSTTLLVGLTFVSPRAWPESSVRCFCVCASAVMAITCTLSM